MSALSRCVLDIKANHWKNSSFITIGHFGLVIFPTQALDKVSDYFSLS